VALLQKETCSLRPPMGLRHSEHKMATVAIRGFVTIPRITNHESQITNRCPSYPDIGRHFQKFRLLTNVLHTMAVQKICEKSTNYESRITSHESEPVKYFFDIGRHSKKSSLTTKCATQNIYRQDLFLRISWITNHESRITNHESEPVIWFFDVGRHSQKSAHYQMCYPKYQ